MTAKTFTKTEAVKQFRLWFADRKAATGRSGFDFRASCWDQFVETNVAEGHLPEAAREWVRDA